MQHRPAVALVEPEIPQNTGNIARTCAATGFELHLVEPLGFEITDRHLKRAGLDYWNAVTVIRHASLAAFLEATADRPRIFVSTKGARAYTDPVYPADCILVFGRETAGLPAELLAEQYERTVRIPMRTVLRSLNLSNSVAILVYEAMRQWGFPGCRTGGDRCNESA